MLTEKEKKELQLKIQSNKHNEVRIVGTFEYQNGKFVTVDKNRQDFKAQKPIPIPDPQIKSYYPLKSKSSVTVDNLLNRVTVKAGEIYPVPDGSVLLLRPRRAE